MTQDIARNLVSESGQFDKEKKYWLKKLAGNPAGSSFRFDFVKSDQVGDAFDIDTFTFRMPADLSAKLDRLTNRSDYNLFLVLLAGLNVLLNKYAGNDDIVVGIPIFSQQSTGEFLNTVVAARNRLTGKMTFKELVLQVKGIVNEAYDHSNYPLERILYHLGMSGTGNGFSLFDVALLLQNIHHRKYLKKVKPAVVFNFHKGQQYIEGKLEYNSRLYRAETIGRIATHLLNVLHHVLEDPDLPIGHIDLLTESEGQQILSAFNDTHTRYEGDKILAELFEEQVRRTPRHGAVVSAAALTYERLNRKANQLARFLRQRGVGANSITAVMVEPSAEMAVAIMAVLKSGSAYLPMDHEAPANRIEYMLKDADCRLLLTQDFLMEKVHFNGEKIDIADDRLYRGADQDLAKVSGPRDLFYMIYTSGTTGRPKGGVLVQRNLVNYVTWFAAVARLTAADKTVLTSSFAFDLGYTNFFGSLLSGGELHLVAKETYINAETLLSYIKDNRISYMKLTPSLFSVIVHSADFSVENSSSLRLVVLGGEEINLEAVERARRLCAGLEVMNHYGPTESTIGSIARFIDFDRFEEYKRTPTIGRPIHNTRVYILDSHLKLCPIGVVGELYIGGDGVGIGYLNRPQLTADRFVNAAARIREGTRSTQNTKSYILTPKSYILYRTGDLARWLPDGCIEFLGRQDSQVKVRGFRVELAEIENQLLNHPDVKEAVVAAHGDKSGGKNLCAYIVPRSSADSFDVSALKESLSSRLPDFMIPASVVLLEKLPLTPNGKVDKRALPLPEFKHTEKYIAPGDRFEESLAGLWSEVLHLEKESISVDANFFEVGGHSLNAAVLVSRMHKEYNVKVSMTAVFEHPTIQELSRYLKGASEQVYTSIQAVEQRDYYVLSSTQSRLYVLQQMELESTAYNISGIFDLTVAVDRVKMEQIFRQLIGRHESLRTSFAIAAGTLVQRIQPAAELAFSIEYCEIEGVGAGERQAKIEAAIRRFPRAFVLSVAPLMRVQLVQIEPSRHLLMVDLHHIISDGVSQGILVRDFITLYKGGALPALRLQYRDYAHWQQSEGVRESFRRQEAYWLAEFPGEVPVLNICTDYPRPSMQSFVGRVMDFDIGREVTGVLNNMARSEGATLFMVLLAVFNVFLSKLSGQQDIVVGVPIAGRRHADLESIMGMFVNTLALRNFASGDQSFPGFVREVRDNTLRAFENQDYQFEDLVERVEVARDLSRNPLFDVMFVFQNIFGDRGEAPEEMFGAEVQAYTHEHRTSKFDLTLTAGERAEKLYFSLEYCTSLFKEATVARFIRYFKEIVSSIVKHPEGKISAIGMMNEEEKRRVLHEFNDTRVEYARDKVLAELFEEQANRTPHHIAVTGACLKSTPYGREQNGRRALTYRELDEQTDHLAGVLRASGVKPDTITAVMMNRSIEMMAALLGVVKAGGAYLPIDPDFPAERIEYILEHSRTPLILTTGDLGSLIAVNGNCRILALDGENTFGGDGDRLEKVRLAGPGNLAYCIYTSGSTGRPKGVMIENRALVNFIKGITDIIDFGDQDSLLALTTISFDIFGLETLLPLTRGCKVVVGTGEDQVNGAAAASAMDAEGVTILQVTPSRLTLLLSQEESAARLGTLKYLLVGGEALPVQLLDQARQVVGGKIYNMYGPTETTIWSTVKDVSGGEALNIGRPIANTGVYILGRGDTLQPVGVVGELCIAGDGLGRGYVNNVELTARKFPFNPYEGGGSLYRTGDVARWLADGNLEFLGRVDDQVKIRGFRIELAEIESRLARHPGIKEAVVACKTDRLRDKHICAYIVTAEESGETAGSMELREYLSQRLPDYMIPSFFIHLEKIPLTPNGKIDRKALPLPELKVDENYTAPRDEVERKLVEIWSEELGVGADIIGIDANFFELGGHSLTATMMIARIHKEFDLIFSLKEIFNAPTIKKVASLIKVMNGTDNRDAAVQQRMEEIVL